MGARVKHISYYFPERVVDNQEIANKFPNWPPDRLSNFLGVDKRFYASVDETSLEMGFKAALKLFEESEISREEIDFILFCTQTPDYLSPTTACILQDRLGLSKDIGAFDFSLGCTGYVYGLAIANSFINSGLAKNVLLVTSDVITKVLNPEDQGTVLFFGDAATATVISYCDKQKILGVNLGTDGGGFRHLMIQNSGFSPKKNINTAQKEPKPYLFMDGSEVFTFSLRVVPGLVKRTLELAGISDTEIDLFVFHQANKYMLETLRKLLKIDANRFAIYSHIGGNTTSSTIPIAVKLALKENRIVANSKILIAGFGVGLSWGAMIIEL